VAPAPHSQPRCNHKETWGKHTEVDILQSQPQATQAFGTLECHQQLSSLSFTI
jgi:hypothetical protein